MKNFKARGGWETTCRSLCTANRDGSATRSIRVEVSSSLIWIIQPSLHTERQVPYNLVMWLTEIRHITCIKTCCCVHDFLFYCGIKASLWPGALAADQRMVAGLNLLRPARVTQMCRAHNYSNTNVHILKWSVSIPYSVKGRGWWWYNVFFCLVNRWKPSELASAETSHKSVIVQT